MLVLIRKGNARVQSRYDGGLINEAEKKFFRTEKIDRLDGSDYFIFNPNTGAVHFYSQPPIEPDVLDWQKLWSKE